jgi:MoaA/NifB/PqqE/SkfB family radical SAM enzyme
VDFKYFDYARTIFRPAGLESVFLFVTSTCNSLCRTCFYWDELNQGRDLSFDQIRTLSATAPAFAKLWISGGEPFLRKDLAEVIELFYRSNGVRHVNLPTNGLLPAKVDAVISYLLERCPDLVIDLNFSLDGLANTHDAIRGVPNNFQKTLATIHMASDKWEGVKRLRRNVVSCVTRENYRELVELAVTMMRDSKIDGQYFEIIRGNPIDASLKTIPKEELKRLHRVLLAFHETYADTLFAHLEEPAKTLARTWYLANVRFHFDIHERNHYGPAKWPMPCTAGKTTIVIDHDGHFRACELRSKLGRLQDFNFNLTAALESDQMNREIAAIPGANCWCTHSCFIHCSSKMSPKVLLFHLPWAYLKYRWQRLPLTDIAELEKFRVNDAPLAAR